MGSVIHRLFTREIHPPKDSLAEEIPLVDPEVSALQASAEEPGLPLVEPGAETRSDLPPFVARFTEAAPDPRGETLSDSPALDASPPPENIEHPDPSNPSNPVEPVLAEEIRLEEKLFVESAVALASASENLPAIEPKSLSLVDLPRVDPEEWRLEEALANHREWLDSKGISGRKMDFSGAQLSDKELISADLRYADMQEVNLKSADLLMADLRGTCLMRAQLDEACLVGANLEGANLEGASLSTAMGLLPRQLAGANLYEASLPPAIAEFHARAEFAKAADTANRYFTSLMCYCAVSWLLIWKTRDAQLLTDSAVLPYVHATTAIPTAEFYLISPVVLLILYLVLHFHLQQAWEKLMELPSVFPDGTEFGANAPRLVMGVARSHFYWLSPDSPSERFIEKWSVRILAYWLVPVTLLLYWARYLTVQEIHGTLLQEALVVGAAGVALYSSLRVGRKPERWILHPSREFKFLVKLRGSAFPYLLGALALFLTFLSVGTMIGVPHETSRAPHYGPANFRRWAPNVLWVAGLDPYADLTEAALSMKPEDWSGEDSQIASIRGPHLNQANLRYAQAYGAFMPNSHLWRADLEGAYFSLADLRGSDLSQSDLQYAILDAAQLGHVNLDRATLSETSATRTDFRNANLSYVNLEKSSLVDARFDSASLYSAQLNDATLIRASLQRADLRDAQLERANLTHADLEQAYLWSAKLSSANLNGAKLQGAILIDADLSGADLRGAVFQGTVLTDANLKGALLDEADLRGVSSTTASQICAAQSYKSALMDDALQAAVSALCGPVSAPSAASSETGAVPSQPGKP